MILIANNKSRNNILNFKNSSIFIAGAAGKYIINFVILIIFARILSPSDYGYWIQLLAIFSIAQFFIECGQINILMSQARSFDDVFRNLLAWNAYLIIATYLVVLPFTIFFLGLENYSINIYIFFIFKHTNESTRKFIICKSSIYWKVCFSQHYSFYNPNVRVFLLLFSTYTLLKLVLTR